MASKNFSFKKRNAISYKQGNIIFSLALILPALLLTITFIIVPIVDSIIKSFMDYKVKNIISGQPGKWNNFENYINLFNNDKLVPAIIVTFSFVAFVVLFQFALGMSLALILNSKIKGARFLRSIMMIPWVVPTVIYALVWLWMF